MFQRIYRKHLKRRNRSGDKISLEKCRESALLEYYTLKEATKYEQKPPENTEELDFYVRVGGRTYLNSEWKALMETQARLANTDLNPSPCWEDLTTHYLQRMFIQDKSPPKKKRTVNIWEE